MKISLQNINTFHLISFLFPKQTFPSLYFHKSVFLFVYFFPADREIASKATARVRLTRKLTIYDINLLICFSRDLID